MGGIVRFSLIKWQDNHTAPKPEVRRVGHALLPTVMAQLRDLLDARIIERGKSATGAPIHLVPKVRKSNPDGTLKEQTWSSSVQEAQWLRRNQSWIHEAIPKSLINNADTTNRLNRISKTVGLLLIHHLSS